MKIALDRTPLWALACALVAVTAVADARAQDTWSDPYPGVRHLHRRTGNQNINVLAIDLCAPGVGVRATGYGERGQTPSGFGSSVGAQAAVNADFFKSGYLTDGLSVHGGAAWPGTADHGYVAPLAFGPRRVELYPHQAITAHEPWMQEVVSGHPTILENGAFRADVNGDPLCTNRHPRTVAGLSADKRTLFLAVVDGRAATRIGMTCGELATLMSEMGASTAMNLDGGGSSAMWLAGPGVVSVPSGGSQRVTGNHLAIYASGAGDAPFCPNRQPQGYLDASDCQAISGWAQDADDPDAVIDAHLYFGGPAGAEGSVGVSVRADQTRDDLCEAIGSCDHGFALPPPNGLRDGQPHQVWAYAIDSEGGANTELPGSPMSFTCAPPDPPVEPDAGLLRHITSGESLAAWQFPRHDIAVLDDAVIAAYAEAAPLPEAPRLVREAGADPVYLVDGSELRHVTSPASMTAWHFSFDAIEEITSADLAGFEIGEPLPAAPFLAKGTGPEVYLFDGTTPDGDGDGDCDPSEPGCVSDPVDDDDLVGGCATSTGGGAGALVVVLAFAARLRRRRRAV